MKPFFYRIDAADLLGYVLSIPRSERADAFLQLAQDLVTRSKASSEYAKQLISEAEKFVEQKRIAGSKGGKQRSSTAQAPLKHRSSGCQASSSSSSSSIKTNTITVPATKQDNHPYEEIITGMNKIIGTNYKVKSDSTRTLIRARIAEGYTAEDFLTVCHNMHTKWANDEKMSQYLRPSTLFNGEKMGGYLNTKPVAKAYNYKDDPNALIY